MSAPKVITAEDRLKEMRAGYKTKLELVIGAFSIPCRLMSASEEITAIARAKADLKIPPHHESARKQFEGLEIQKSILALACTVDGVPYVNREFLDKLSLSEIETLYDQYVSTIRSVNPNFESMTGDEVSEMIIAVKKKEKDQNDFFMWQLAEIGKFFLAKILPTVNDLGS